MGYGMSGDKRIRRRIDPARRRQRGAVFIFIAAVMLPLMFFCFTISLDLLSFYRERIRVQRVLDDAAMLAYKFLPYQREALQAANQYLEQSGYSRQVFRTAVDGDGITIAYFQTLPIPFGAYFREAAGFPVKVYSRVRGTAFDTYIAVDRSRYLAPDGPLSELWGEERDWPAAYFFSHQKQFREYKADGSSSEVNSRYLTQLCFNPPFSALKMAGIRVYEYLAGFKLNAVGLGMFPGGGVDSLDEVRPLQYGLSSVPGGGEADFPSYNWSFRANEYCAAAAENENQAGHYHFPILNPRIEGLWRKPAGAPQMIVPGVWTFNEQYRSYLRTAEVVWSQAAHHSLPQSHLVLQSVLAKVMPSVFTGRGGLVNSALKRAVILAADVPWAEGRRFNSESDSVAAALQRELDHLKTIIGENPRLAVKIYYVLMQHDGSSRDLKDRTERLGAFFRGQNPADGLLKDRFAVQLVVASSAQEMLSKTVGELVLDKKSGIISK